MKQLKQTLQGSLRECKARINIRVYAGVAKPSPKMGQALGPLGINMMQFCKDFNAKTQNIRPDVPLRVCVMAYPDRTFTFFVKPPETTWFLRKACGVNKFTNLAGYVVYDRVSMQQIYEIAKVKKELDPHLMHVSLPAITRQIICQLQSLGVQSTIEYQKPEEIIRPVVKV